MVKHKIGRTTVQVHLVPVDEDGELGEEIALQEHTLHGKKGLIEGLPQHLKDVEALAIQLDASANGNRRQRRSRAKGTSAAA